jgi:hypothetical protein
MTVYIVIAVLCWEYIASLITSGVILKSIKIKDINADTMSKWANINPKKALVLTILNFPLVIVSPLLLFISNKAKQNS